MAVASIEALRIHHHWRNFGLLPILRKWGLPCFVTTKEWYYHYVPQGTTVMWNVFRYIMNKVSSCIAGKMVERLWSCAFPWRQYSFSSGSLCSQILWWHQTSCVVFILTLHKLIFGYLQHWRIPSMVTHFQVFLLLQQRFWSSHNICLKKHLQWPCSCGDSIMKNVCMSTGFLFFKWKCFTHLSTKSP